MIQARIIVKPRTGASDPQATAVEQAIRDSGFAKVEVAHVGREIALRLPTDDAAEAHSMISDLCTQLLVNPNLESYEVVFQPAP